MWGDRESVFFKGVYLESVIFYFRFYEKMVEARGGEGREGEGREK